MSNIPKAPAPVVNCQVIIQGMSNGSLNIAGTGDFDLDLTLVLAAAASLNNERKKQTKKPLIEVPDMGAAALSVVQGRQN